MNAKEEMLELSPQDFRLAQPLLEASGMRGHHTMIYSVLEGRHPGRVFADSLEDPQTMLFCNLTGFYFALGEPNESLAWAAIAPWFVEPMSQEFTVLYSTSLGWNEALSRVMPEATGTRLAFELQSPPEPALNWRERVPAGFSVQPITAPLAQSILDGTGTGGYGIDPWFVRIVGGPEGYAAQGLGFALVDETNGQIASVCGYCALGNGEAELEVGTCPEYRGRGLAATVSAAFLEQCRQQGWKPAYTCTRDNLASINVAHKLGFLEVEEIQGFPFPSTPIL